MVVLYIHMDTRTDTDQQVATVVTSRLRSAGVAQRAAAEQTGIPFTTLRRRLTGHSSFTMSELARIAALLELTVQQLLEDDAA